MPSSRKPIQIHPSGDQFFVRITAGNGKILYNSERYKEKRKAIKGIKALLLRLGSQKAVEELVQDFSTARQPSIDRTKGLIAKIEG